MKECMPKKTLINIVFNYLFWQGYLNLYAILKFIPAWKKHNQSAKWKWCLAVQSYIDSASCWTPKSKTSFWQLLYVTEPNDISKSKGILFLWTLRRDRISCCKITLYNELNKRGAYNRICFQCQSMWHIEFRMAKQPNYYDAFYISMFAGRNPIKGVSRYDRKEKCRKKFPPFI